MATIICHRGVWRDHENTFDSLIEINKLQQNNIIFGIEFDIQIIDSGIWVLHDENLLRTHNISKKLEELTSIEINNLHIPELSQVLECIQDNSIIINIEIKTFDNQVPDLKLLETCLLNHKKDKTNIFLSSFDTGIVACALSLNFKTGLILWDDYDIEIIEMLISSGLSYLISSKSLFPIMNKLFGSKIQLIVYTLFDDLSTESQDILLAKDLLANNIPIITDSYIRVLELFHESALNLDSSDA